MTAPTRQEHIHGTVMKGHDLCNGHFKKHKVLPRPRDDRAVEVNQATPVVAEFTMETTPSASSLTSPTSSPRTLKHQLARIGTGPDLPPTPPNPSRVSSGSRPAQSPNPSPEDAGVQTPQASSRRPPATPPDQRSPPTPDVTPPQPANRPRALRSSVPDRDSSQIVTTAETRTAFSNPAREESFSLENEAASLTKQSAMTSSPPSQPTVPRFPVSSTASHAVQPRTLNCALERLTENSKQANTKRNRGEAAHLDGGFGSPRHMEMEKRDVDVQRRVVSAVKRKAKSVASTSPRLRGAKKELVEVKPVTPEKANQAVRSVSLKAFVTAEDLSILSPQKSTPRRRRTGPARAQSESSRTVERRRSSGPSRLSARPTVIEAMLVDNPSALERNRTLRHVRKRRELREPSPRGRQAAAGDGALQLVKKSSLPNLKSEHAHRHESYTWATSFSSVASPRARREVQKSGGIPVVVIPDRRSSSRPKSKEPSLRSTSSRHSRTISMDSAALDRLPPHVGPLSFDRPSRWNRSNSVSDRSDQRTMDFPPTIPPRSSSLSAPTTRTTSRTASLTVESLKALNEMYSQNERPITMQSAAAPAVATTATTTMAAVAKTTMNPATPLAKATLPVSQVAASPSISLQCPQTPRSDRELGHDSRGVDHHDDGASTRKYSSRTTPFSTISMETSWTAPSVSEAQAIHIYPHQNSSVLRINHFAKSQAMPHATNMGLERVDSNEPPTITATSPEGGVTMPEQQRKLWEDVDSPLRNPRSPPDPPMHPPAFNFIPATPSGLTPDNERQDQLGNLYEVTAESPDHWPSFVRRALSRRRHSIGHPPSASKRPGFLARTFSLSRHDRKSADAGKWRSFYPDMEPGYGEKEDQPAEQDKLHPHWRPQWDNDDGDCDCSSCRRGSEDEVEIYRYPLVDNRPRPLKRSLSAKMKKTFAILPARQDYQYQAHDAYGTERRTIRRTPSGNLRVVRRRSSDYSLRQQMTTPQAGRLSAFVSNPKRGFWRRHSLRRRRDSVGLRRFSSLSNRLERMPSLGKSWSEKRRVKRTRELRQMISGPREVRDGVGEVVRLSNLKNQQAGSSG